MSDESWTDLSQRILNVLMPDTVIPIHRHNESSETVIVCRGKVCEEFWRREESVLVWGDGRLLYDPVRADMVKIYNYNS